MAQPHATQARSTRWSLEVVRGRDVGRVFELAGSEIVLGHGLDGAGGLDLREQEAGSPRRMAARQAVLEAKGTDLVIRDLDSPGGTFVNRQRLLAGQARRLQPGDEIQVGGVQLRLVDPKGPSSVVGQPPSAARAVVEQPPPAAAGRLPVPYAINGTVSCRTWDDFLVVAAQRWRALSDELASGRLADYLRRIQRTDLLPRPDPTRSLDEQLDQWLARLPATQSSAPELDVHPTSVEVRTAAGGATRHVLRITNVGYRLLRATARVEPAGTSWLKLGAPYDGRPFDTVEETELPVEVFVPESVNGPLSAEIVVESNGGTRRVVVRVGLPEKIAELPDAVASTAGLSASALFQPLARTIARYTMRSRIAAGIVGALAFRALVFASGWLPLGAAGASLAQPRLPALAVVCGALGLIVGVLKGRGGREDRPSDRIAAGVAAALFGIMVAAVVYAIVLTAERVLGSWASSPWAVGWLWAAIGAAVAGITGLFNPDRGSSLEASP
jgi:pSer/pThr/pTyr-binding forkhead associated (FHA) protein